MSYARFGADGSDVYVYMDYQGFLNCCGCVRQEFSFHAHSTDEMVRHLEAHIQSGDIVPDHVIPELRDDDKENFPQEVSSG